jgi:hypothetical protein
VSQELCNADSCDITWSREWNAVQRRWEPVAKLKVYQPTWPPAAGNRMVVNGLVSLCAASAGACSPGNTGGAGVLFRDTDCATVAKVADACGVEAIEWSPRIFNPVVDPNAATGWGVCDPGVQAAACVPTKRIVANDGTVTEEAGGISVMLAAGRGTVPRTRLQTINGCDLRQTLIDIRIDECAQNAAQVDEQHGMGVYVRAQRPNDCVYLTVEADEQATCNRPTAKVIVANLQFAQDVAGDANGDGALFNTSSCTPFGGLASYWTNSSCLKVVTQEVVSTTGNYKVSHVEPVICDSTDNAFVCGTGGFGVFFAGDVAADPCVSLKVVDSTVGCGGGKRVVGSLRFAEDVPGVGNTGGLTNLASCSPTGVSAYLQESTCFALAKQTVAGPNGSSYSVTQIVPKICESADQALTCGAGGLGVYFGSDLDADSCIQLKVVEGGAGCGGNKKVIGEIRFAPSTVGSGDDQLFQMSSCSPGLGLATWAKKSTCIRPVVEETTGGYATSFEPIISTLDDPLQGLSCNSHGMGVWFESGGCISFAAKPGNGLDPRRMTATLNFDSDARNAAYCLPAGCGGAGGVGVTFANVNNAAQSGIEFRIDTETACGSSRKLVHAGLKLAEGCNGLEWTSTGYKAPYKTTGDTGGIGTKIGKEYSASGSGETIALPPDGEASACNPATSCRDAIGIIVVRAPAVEFVMKPAPGDTACASIGYGGNVGIGGGDPYGETTYAQVCVPGATAGGKPVTWKTAWHFTISSQTEVFRFGAGLAPGKCLTCDLTPTVTISGSGTHEVRTSSYAINAWVFSIL